MLGFTGPEFDCEAPGNHLGASVGIGVIAQDDELDCTATIRCANLSTHLPCCFWAHSCQRCHACTPAPTRRVMCRAAASLKAPFDAPVATQRPVQQVTHASPFWHAPRATRRQGAAV